MPRIHPSTRASERALAAPELIASLPRRISDIPTLVGVGSAHAALRHDGRAWTYAQLASAVRHAAQALATAGVRGGDRILVVGENCPEMLALLFAASRIDPWPV